MIHSAGDWERAIAAIADSGGLIMVIKELGLSGLRAEESREVSFGSMRPVTVSRDFQAYFGSAFGISENSLVLA